MKLNWWDRFLLSVAPKTGVARLRARTIAENLTRHYEATVPGRRTDNWQRSAADADLNLRGASKDLRWLARDLLRNNAWSRAAQRAIADATIGHGISPKPTNCTPEVKARALELWNAWAGTTECESEGRHTFAGLQHLAMKAIVSDGEVFLRRRGRLSKDGLTIPMQLQILESDYLDTSRNLVLNDSGGPTIQGIEFDAIGRRTGYWMWAVHPGSGRNTEASKLIPADDVLHIYYTERPGQSRGASWFAPAIVALQDLDAFDDAELVKQKVAACFSAFVTDDGMGRVVGEASADDSTETLEPGMIHHLAPGKEITFGNPPQLTSDTLPTRTLRRIAASMGVPYEAMTGDYSQVNFSSARMARLAFYGHVTDYRENMVVPLLCKGVWDWAMSLALPGVAPDSEWTCPPMPMLEPDKEGLAYSRLVRNGVMTFSEMIREQGFDPESHLAEYAEDLKKLDALGIKLDSDVRAVSATGQEQPSETAAAAPPSDSETPEGEPANGP